jgi:hypothetical protein
MLKGSKTRDSLNGVWILDKSRPGWSMRGYLECLNVNELAIQAHEKGESEFDTYHTISIDLSKVTVIKRSRVNNDLKVELELGKEYVEYLKPENRPKTSLATSPDGKTQLEIKSTLLTVNGMAYVVDKKHLEQAGDHTTLVQELIITNGQTRKSHKTTRYFLPYDGKLEARP